MKALAMRQEILEAVLTEKNNKTALKLAWMELLPNFNISYAQNRYAFDAASPAGSLAIDSKDNTASVGFNIPIFFWFRQKEDIRSASNLLDAARQNRRNTELQTETSVVQLYHSTDLAYQTALLYKNFLVPLADKNFRVALVAYQSKHIDFTTLANILQNVYSARVTYLTSMNQFLAGQVALEQLMGGPLK
jgi:outer membrane protein TolC